MNASTLHLVHRRLLPAALLLLLGLPAAHAETDTQAETAPPWMTPFAPDAAALLAAAAAVPMDEADGVHMLLDEQLVSFDEQGRRSSRRRLVYRILSPATVDGWSQVQADWSPWYEERPQLRARVITADGHEHWLDPATVGEFSPEEDQPDVLSDRRQLRAPLPAMAVGVVVEEETAITESRPMFAAGVVHSFIFAWPVPVERLVLRIEAPAALRLKVRTELLPEMAEESQLAGDRMRWHFTTGPLEPFEETEPLLPGDQPWWPMVQVSTGSSWQQVARDYAQVVDQQLAGNELRDTVKQVTRGATDRGEKIDRLLAWLQTQVRYTGLQFGEAAIVPHSPAETLARRYGDCKDQASLLIALLREAGMPAWIALLRTGPDRDVSPELPGLGMFDHTIVFVPGKPDLWIDPTDEFARAGQLPLMDQGRLALIARPDTTALVTTPVATAADNLVRETREIFLTELGGGRVVEISEYQGSPDSGSRHAYKRLTDTELQENLSSYVIDHYAADRLLTWEMSKLSDLSKPLRISVEAEGADIAFTDVRDAAVAINPANLLYRLPQWLRGQGEEEVEPSPRQAEMELYEPHVVEHVYLIHPPDGYRVEELPASEVRQLGPATLATSYVTADNGTVTATLRFDTGPRRYLPQQVDELRAGLIEINNADPVLITFEQVGESYLALGQIREALAEFQRLAASQPERALPHSRISMALLAAGLGAAARQEAQRAVELEPELDMTYQIQGLVLQHDLIGREYHPGWDPQGSEAALRRAKELDPNNLYHRLNLALALEHDAQGLRYTPGERLNQAITEYQELREALGPGATDKNLLIALVRAERFAEARTLAQELGYEGSEQALLLVATAALDGAPAAIRTALKISDAEQRRLALTGAGGLLFQMRRYPLAAELFNAAAKGAPNAATLLGQVDQMRRTRRHEEIELPADEVETAIKRFYMVMLKFDGDLPEDIFSRHLASELDELWTAVQSAARQLRNKQLDGFGSLLDVTLDLLLSNAEIRLDGDDNVGYRARTRFSHANGTQESFLFVVREGGTYRILTTDDYLPPLGQRAWELLEQGDLPGARRWLDWAVELTPTPGGDDPVAGHPLARLWRAGEPASETAARLASAALMASGAQAEQAVALLEELAGSDVAPTSAILRARLLGLLRLERYTQAVPIAHSLVASQPTSAAAAALLASTLTLAGQGQELRRFAEARLAQRADDHDAMLWLYRLDIQEGELESAHRRLERLVQLSNSEFNDYNELAWLDVVRGEVNDHTLDRARRAVQLSSQQNYASLHTLATVYAELGRTTEAREILLQAMATEGLEEPRPDDWYVFGRIAEHFGVAAAAADAYRRVEPPEPGGAPDLTSTYALAQRRLAVLAAELQ